MKHDELSRPTRRRMLGILGGGLGAVALVACGDDSTATSSAERSTTTAGASSASTTSTTAASAASSATTAATAVTSCTKIPEETAGPYPGDGTNGPNVLTQGGVVRSDMRTSIGSSTALKGVPLTVTLTVLDKSSCTPIAGAAVYMWHCDMAGNYSMYSQGVTNETFLRGVQVCDANGQVTFTSIFPGAYSGRWPHIHFEVFPSAAVATNGRNKQATSQLAMPEASANLVYATAGYEASAKNMPQTTLKTDNVFSDGYATQLPTIAGDVAKGFAATLNVGV